MNYFIAAVILCLILYGCSSGWKLQLDSDRDLPWCGKNTKVFLETKTTSSPFSTTGYRSHWRWVSKRSKQNPARYGWQIDDFLKQNEILEQWPKSQSYVGTDEGTKQLIRSPYVIELASVEPLVVFMRPKLERDGSIYRGDLLTSQYLTNHYYYGTRFLYHPETLWFSPDLNQKPKLINLNVDGEKKYSVRR